MVTLEDLEDLEDLETPNTSGAAPLSFLMMIGTALGGWLLAKGALAGQKT